MSISLSDLAGASHGPAVSRGQLPKLITAGDSIIWGQGLRPEHKFRELVRVRLSEEEAEAIPELSMARSGATIYPDKPATPGEESKKDEEIVRILRDNFNSLKDSPYSPQDYTREVPYSSLTTYRQLEYAAEILDQTDASATGKVKWIILDGGINDVDIITFLSPLVPVQAGYFFAGWPALILDRTKEIQPEIETTLLLALSNFPNATIVVTGYYPILSYYSLASLTEIQSIGLLWGLTNSALALAIGLDMLATASAAWQSASNEILRRAIRSVRVRNPGRNILFARSGIEGSHCLFANRSWLWGYSKVPPEIPLSLDEWRFWFAGARAEDEVPNERADRCARFEGGFTCRLASLGHPNVDGARDYARSIIVTLEDAGLINSDLHPCSLAHRRRKEWCREKGDKWAYRCFASDARIGKNCSNAVRAAGDAAKGLFTEAGNRLKEAGSNLKDAAHCFDPSERPAAQAAANQFSNAEKRLDSACARVLDAIKCWNQTDIDIQECADKKAMDMAKCYQAYDKTITDTCNTMQCDSFGDCKGRYGKYNPKRYVCLAARVACDVFWAGAKATCIAYTASVLAVCVVAAESKYAICLAGVVLGNFICTVDNTARSVGNALDAGFHVAAGVIVGMGIPSEMFGCALGNVFKAAGKVVAALGDGVAGVIVGAVAGLMALGCAAGRWVMNRGCRAAGWLGEKACETGVGVIAAGCWVGTVIAIPFRTFKR